MLDILVFCCVVLPFIIGIVLYYVRSGAIRKLLVPAAVAVMALAAVGLGAHGAFHLEAHELFGLPLDNVLTLLDFILLLYILALGWKLGSRLVMGMTALQLVGLIYLKDVLMDHGAPVTAFAPDGLSLIMVIIISVVGGLITIYGLGYMDIHEEHLHLRTSRQPRFFAIIFCFLGAMNGLVLCNNLSWMFFFWEMTTLCSFWLIGHDRTKEAEANAYRALWMNVLGGLAFVSAMLFIQKSLGTLSTELVLQKMVALDVKSTAMLLPFAFLCLAAFTKSAQVPFESWLCGAMVAPTPVSALLHSATMVKAGTYGSGLRRHHHVHHRGPVRGVHLCGYLHAGGQPEQRQENPGLFHHIQSGPDHRLRGHQHPGLHGRGHHDHHLPFGVQGPVVHVRGRH